MRPTALVWMRLTQFSMQWCGLRLVFLVLPSSLCATCTMQRTSAALESIMSTMSVIRLDVASDRFWHSDVSVEGKFLES